MNSGCFHAAAPNRQAEEMAAIAEGIADLRAGRTVGHDEMAEIMRRAGRA
jgi:predicted transcriptional regulator